MVGESPINADLPHMEQQTSGATNAGTGNEFQTSVPEGIPRTEQMLYCRLDAPSPSRIDLLHVELMAPELTGLRRKHTVFAL